jgi:hypothetical protein
MKSASWKNYAEVSGLAAIACFSPVSALAQIYKCTEADGGIVYAQAPCSTELVADTEATSWGAEAIDCRYANTFAAWTARLMHAGTTSNDFFDRYGGLSSMSRGSVGVINYVYSFRANDDVTVERIAGLSLAMCEAGSFGDASCSALPSSYTETVGGCDSEDGPLMPEEFVGEPPAEQAPPQARQQSAPAASSRSASETQECKKPLRDQVDEIDATMRSGYSSAQGEIYKEQLRSLTQAMRRCEQ